MSQLSTFRFAFVPPPPGLFVATLTGNSGGAVPPDLLNNINVISDTTQGTPRIVGNIGTNTLTLTFSNAVTGNTAIGLNSLIAAGAGANDNTSLGVSTLQSLTTGDNNTAIGFAALMDITTASDNTAVGSNALTLATGAQNTAVGSGALATSSTAVANVAVGFDSLTLASTGSDNTAVGQNSANRLTTGASNTAVGVSTLQITTGSNNVAIGQTAGNSYATNESSNIVIGNTGTITDQNTTRIGTTGGGAGQQSRAFVGGVDGVNVGSTAKVVTMGTGATADQLGTTVITAGTGITITPGANTIGIAVNGSVVGQTITGNSGGALSPTAGNWNIVTANSTAKFVGAGSTLTLDFSLSNLILGNNGSTITVGAANDGFGLGVLQSITSGSSNTAMGNASLQNVTTGSQTSAYGASSGTAINTGGNNTLIGFQSGLLLQSGNSNVALGYQSGSAWGAAVSNNIALGSIGAVADSARIRIGTNGTHTTTFIAGIDTVNVGSVAKVVTMASDQLGTATITAGTGITVTPGANTITITANGTTTLNYVNVNTTPYVVLSTDDYLGVDCSTTPIQINFPNAPATGRVYVVKDYSGSAAGNNITLTSVGGAIGFDGALTYVMNTAFQAVSLLFDGTNYQIF